MWIVNLALRRPYTFVVVAMLIFLIGTLAALRMPVDILPSIDIPIIGVAWQYQGLSPDEMSGRIITPFERALTTTVNDIEHIESSSYTTFGVVKIYFHRGVNIATANAQVTAISQTLLKQMPPGATPPLILNYSASTVPTWGRRRLNESWSNTPQAATRPATPMNSSSAQTNGSWK